MEPAPGGHAKDDPSDKATTTIQRITVPSTMGMQVVSNGVLRSVEEESGATETWTWFNDKPIATYLVSMAISNYTYSDAVYTAVDGVTTMPVRHAIYPENVQWEGSAAAGTVRILEFLARRVGEYPFLNQKYYSPTWNIPGGMEHQTCTSMLPGYISTGEESLNVHELAHHWFGDKITCSSFDHLWLNEGFATYFEALWREHIDLNALGYWDMMNTWRPTDVQPVVGPDSDQFLSANVYYKGAWVLHMLRHVLGTDSFNNIIKQWASSPSV